MRTAKTLIRLGARSFCWFCHVAAHLLQFSDFKSSVILVTVSCKTDFNMYVTNET